MTGPVKRRSAATGRLPRAHAADFYELRLYIAGQTSRSLAALANLKRICEEHLQGRYRIEVIDLLKHPQLAKGDQILALPTLVRRLPEPIRKPPFVIRRSPREFAVRRGDRCARGAFTQSECAVDLRLGFPHTNGDAAEYPASREFARRLLSHQAVSGDDVPVSAGDALQRTCTRVSDNLRDVLGEHGCSALLARALAQTEVSHPELKHLRRQNGNSVSLDGVRASIDAHGIPAVTAAIESLLVALIDILGRLIGGDMVMRVIDSDVPRSRRVAGAHAP